MDGQNFTIDACDLRQLKPWLEKAGFHFSRAKGQNFLTAAWVPERIAVEAGVDEGTGVLEIGPGVGALTQRLCARAGAVCAVELDRRLEPILQLTVGQRENFSVIWGDALKLELPELVRERFAGLRPTACANLPYYITTPVLTALLEARCFERVTVMVQREVAARIAAAPDTADYGAFSLFCQYYAEPELLFTVPPECFVPRPQVYSAVVTLRVRTESPWQLRSEALFFRAVRASFSQRRKKLSNGLASGFPRLGKDGAQALLARCGFPETVRGETLGIPEFVKIANALYDTGFQ